MYYYSGFIAERPVCYAFRHHDTGNYFGHWISPTEARENCVRVPEYDIQEQYEKYGIPDSPYAEYALSVFHTSDYLLSYDICAFHAAVFLWNGKAYCFTGPSGTGKSTQLRNWCGLYGDATKILNGDKPILKSDTDHIQVYPSPWKGKEGLGDDSLSAPLGGVICLTQGETNQIRRIGKRTAGGLLIPRFLCRFEDRETVLSVCNLTNLLLDTVPVWQLINTGDQTSTELVYETLNKEI